MTTFNTLALSLIRTYAPIIVGAVVSWLITLGIELDARTQAGFIVFLTGVLQAAYYTAVRLAEQRWPGVGVLLGAAKTPDTYSNDKTIPGEVVEDHGLISDYPEPDTVEAEEPEGPAHAAA